MNLYGRLMVNLSEDRNFAVHDYAEEINNVIRPPAKVKADDIYVRAIYLVSDQVNSYGGRFPREELANLCRMIIDSPVLIGHNKSSLPIARNFKAEVIEKSEECWVKVWYYWLKKAEGSEALLANIDGGIYKEGSIGFIFSLPECGICGEDIRSCSHVPLKKYGSGEDEKVCHYNYRRIEKVLETSLVFRGANPNTHTTNELIFNNGISGKAENDTLRQGSLRHNPDKIYFDAADFVRNDDDLYAAPLLFGLPVVCEIEARNIRLTFDGREIPLSSRSGLYRDLMNLGCDDIRLMGSLFTMKGKQRLPLYTWKDAIFEESAGNTSRLMIESAFDVSGNVLEHEKSTEMKNKIKSCFYIGLKKYRKAGNYGSLLAGNSVSKYGMEIVDPGKENGREINQIRKPGTYLLKVISSEKTRSRKYCHRVAFADSDDDTCFKTYETSIPAEVGDTLLVKAVNCDDVLNPRGLIVEDNLGIFYQADKKGRIVISIMSQSCYSLRRVENSAIFLLQNGGHKLSVIFPQFNHVSLENNKSLIGYAITQPDKLKDVLRDNCSSQGWENGKAHIQKSRDDGCVVSLEGKSFSGKYCLRPAFWNKRKLLLFSKLN